MTTTQTTGPAQRGEHLLFMSRGFGQGDCRLVAKAGRKVVMLAVGEDSSRTQRIYRSSPYLWPTIILSAEDAAEYRAARQALYVECDCPRMFDFDGAYERYNAKLWDLMFKFAAKGRTWIG